MTRRQLVTAVVLALLAGSLGWYLWSPSGGPGLTVTAEFSSVRALHAGDEVRIRGVAVGNVLEVQPKADKVVVKLRVRGDHRIARDAGAVIIAPTLVGGRYLQLTGVDEGSGELADGDVITRDRTAVPVEWDEVKTQLTTLADALGPDKAGPGPLAEALDAVADASRGNGTLMRETLASAADAVETINASKGDLFATLENLGLFLTALNENDAQVREFATQLADIAVVLDTNRNQMRTFLSTSNRVVRTVDRFVRSHSDQLAGTVTDARRLTSQLADLRLDVANVLHLAPTTLANFYNIYNPSSGAFTGRPVLPYGGALSNVVCQSIYSVGGTLADCRSLIGPLLDQFDLKELPISLSGPQQPGTPDQETTP